MKRAKTAPLSIAPMMDRTDRHYRYFMRLITQRTLLYTEMVTTKSIIHGDQERLLGYDQVEHPLALQLGGDDPRELVYCSRLAKDLGYDEVNLNIGCPSNRVQSGNFGACLMSQPQLVADGVAAILDAVAIPVTIKHRIGIDDLDRYEDMVNFVEIVSKTGANRFTVHARKAWLEGLSPKQNRNVPPLRYDDVYRLKNDFPHLDIEINGGIKTFDEVQTHLEKVDAVMIGRAAYDNPWQFVDADRRFFGDEHVQPSRIEVAEKMITYIEKQMQKGLRMMTVSRHMLQLFSGISGARRWRREVGFASAQRNGDLGALYELLQSMEPFAGQKEDV